MNLTKILSIVFLLVAIGTGYYLVNSVKSDIDFDAELRRTESQIVEKLKLIRDAQIAYRGGNGKYASDWDSLISFVDTGKIYIVQRREEIKLLAYGAEETTTILDTIGSVSVMDSLFSPSKVPNFNLQRLPYKPGTDVKFEIFAGKIERSGQMVDVFEIRDPNPMNPARRRNDNERALRVGSKTDVTTTGNWE
ncbi:hypothetical protein [Peijinzhouia sedimentorum]